MLVLCELEHTLCRSRRCSFALLSTDFRAPALDRLDALVDTAVDSRRDIAAQLRAASAGLARTISLRARAEFASARAQRAHARAGGRA